MIHFNYHFLIKSKKTTKNSPKSTSRTPLPLPLFDMCTSPKAFLPRASCSRQDFGSRGGSLILQWCLPGGPRFSLVQEKVDQPVGSPHCYCQELLCTRGSFAHSIHKCYFQSCISCDQMSNCKLLLPGAEKEGYF